MALRNVDSLLVKDNQERMEGVTPGSTPPFEEKSVDEIKPLPGEQDAQSIEAPHEEVKEEVPAQEVPEAASSDNKDEYGNELPAARMYSEEEVQNMIRDRLSRGRHAQQSVQEPPMLKQQSTENFTPDPNSGETWEAQLENFIENTIQKREQKQQSVAHQYREQQVQAVFESKFTAGMQKYSDFQDVVSNKPITDSMMLATRGMVDPAAFIYSAAKHHGKELERIAQIADPFQQGAEIGKLEERMRKVRNVTSASKPLSHISSDTGAKQEIKESIDARIFQHARNKLRR